MVICCQKAEDAKRINNTICKRLAKFKTGNEYGQNKTCEILKKRGGTWKVAGSLILWD